MDTKRTLRQSDALDKYRGLHLIEPKQKRLTFSPKLAKEIVYRFKRLEREPSRIARELSSQRIAVKTADVNAVLRSELQTRDERPLLPPALAKRAA